VGDELLRARMRRAQVAAVLVVVRVEGDLFDVVGSERPQ